MAKRTSLKPGDIAPEFDLPAFPGKRVKLGQFKGKQNVVLYFYPQDDTPGCTTEACDFRDNVKLFEDQNTVVLGISPDDVESHTGFVQKFTLPFRLLADTDHAVAGKYGVWAEKLNFGKKYMGIVRTTFLIDKRGKIAAVWPNIRIAGHVGRVLAVMSQLISES